MVTPVPGGAPQPFSVLYQPGGAGQSGDARGRAQSSREDRQSFSDTLSRAQGSGSSGDMAKAGSDAKSESVRYASYDSKAGSASVSAGGEDQRRGGVLDITV